MPPQIAIWSRNVFCSQLHSSDSKLCPKWKLEKEIQTIQTSKNITYVEVRKLIAPQPSQTYAQVAKSFTGQAIVKKPRKNFPAKYTETSTPRLHISKTSIRFQVAAIAAQNFAAQKPPLKPQEKKSFLLKPYPIQ
ncbi:hypothetical protein TNCV_1582691 [Trichonephila clavipes]|nr:hypothetical protein TNCV_1582691 [Trichonephila clavipes]